MSEFSEFEALDPEWDRNRNEKDWDTYTCDHCGIEYSRPKAWASGKKGREYQRHYCSRTCSQIGQREPGVLEHCAQCGAEVKYRPPGRRKTTTPYCSPRCRNIHVAARRIVNIERVCELCGVTFQTKPFKVRDGKGKFCGKVCSNRAHSGYMKESWKARRD